MAGNRLQRTGSIFLRVTGLMRAEAIKEGEMPMWYNIYKAFPPRHDPDFGRPLVMKEIKPIFYAEDIIRGKFAKSYGSLGHHDLVDQRTKFISQRFVEKYMELERSGKYLDDETIFTAVEEALAEEGLNLERIDKVKTTDDGKMEAIGTESGGT